MKKLAVGFGVFVMAVGSLMGCSSLGSGGNEQGEILKELPEGFDKETVKEQAMEDIEIAQSEDYESWKSRFAKDLQSSLTEESYDSYLKILEKQGEFKDFGKCTYLGQIKDNKKYGGVIIVVKYEEGVKTPISKNYFFPAGSPGFSQRFYLGPVKLLVFEVQRSCDTCCSR